MCIIRIWNAFPKNDALDVRLLHLPIEPGLAVSIHSTVIIKKKSMTTISHNYTIIRWNVIYNTSNLMFC